MKGKFIGKIKDDKSVRYFLFWIPVWRKKRSGMLKSIMEQKAATARLLDMVQQVVDKQSQLMGELGKLRETVCNMRTYDLYARFQHPAVFEKYKGIYSGQDMVIVGAGPTLDAYTPIPGAIHVGVNRTYQCRKLELDYLFAQDGGPVTEVPELTNYRKGECKRFFGVHPHPAVTQISDAFVEANAAERYYFVMADSAEVDHYYVPLDLAHQPLSCAHSVITCAFQFALWCHPRRIYLVGCDCSSAGYFKGDSGVCAQWLYTNGLQREWQRMAEFAKRHYRDIEIISINPVGLRGMFKDLDTNKEEE